MTKIRPLRTRLLCSVTTVLLAVSGLTTATSLQAAAAPDDSTPSPTQAAELYRVLPDGYSALDLESAWSYAAQNEDIVGFGLGWTNVRAEFNLDRSESVKQNQSELSQLTSDYGSSPKVLYFISSSKSGRHEFTQSDIQKDQLADATIESAPAHPEDEESSQVGLRSLSGQTWAPSFTRMDATNTASNKRQVDIWSEWSGNHRPTLMPEDWGIEIDLSLYNDGLTGSTRPLCNGEDVDSAFWASRKSNGFEFWSVEQSGTNLAAAEPYLDYEDTLDSCNRMSMAIGMGKPRKLPQQTPGSNYWFVHSKIIAGKGSQPSSRISGGYQAVDDLCVGIPANTHCMGLNTAKKFPGPGGSNDNYYSASRVGFSPGTVYWESAQMNSPKYTNSSAVGTSFGDLSGNGSADVVTSRFRAEGNETTAWAGSSSSTLVSSGSRQSVMDGLDYARKIPDINGDKYTDFLGRGKDGNLYLYYGGPSITLYKYKPPSQIAIGSGWNSMSLITPTSTLFGASGVAIVARRNTDGVLMRYPFTGSGFGSPTEIGSGWGATKSMTTLDWNRDGIADIVAVKSDGNLYLYKGTSSGWTSPSQIGHGWGSTYEILNAGDFSGDKYPDVLARRSDGTLMVYSVSNGGFGGSREIGHGFSPTTFVVLA